MVQETPWHSGLWAASCRLVLGGFIRMSVLSTNPLNKVPVVSQSLKLYNYTLIGQYWLVPRTDFSTVKKAE